MWLSAAISAMCQEIPAWNTMHGCHQLTYKIFSYFLVLLNQLISRQSILNSSLPPYVHDEVYFYVIHCYSSFYKIALICLVDLQIKVNQNKTLTCIQLTVLTGWSLVSVSFMDFSIHCDFTAGYTHSHCCLTD